MAADPGAPEFPALAESLRRAGNGPEACAVARAGLARDPGSEAGRVALALALLDAGDPEGARQALRPLADRCLAETAGLSDDEFERAFDAAETDREALIDPNTVAAEAVAHADAGAQEGLAEEGEDGPRVLRPAFATATMAELLERQGDADGAARIRAALAGAAPAAAAPGAAGRRSERERVVATLERWLGNLQGGARA